MKMYESPLKKICGEIQSQIVKQDEENIMCQVKQSVGYYVDKEELIKALQYDRNQYEKGYADGRNDVLDKIRAEIEKYECDCRLTVDDYTCSKCTDNVFNSIYGILDKYKAECEVQDADSN